MEFGVRAVLLLPLVLSTVVLLALIEDAGLVLEEPASELLIEAAIKFCAFVND
jgi:hypothetical protein